jgi:FAD/FMN-containing dehydrogenase
MSTTVLQAQVMPRGFTKYENRHQTYTQRIRKFFDIWNPLGGDAWSQYRATSAAIQQLIGEAVKREVRLRALGGGWSFSQVAATDGWMLNTKPLNLLFRFAPEDVAAGYPEGGTQLRFAQCGVSVKELDDRLATEGRSLRTHGASNGQTLAGAMSTGTHGSAIDVGDIAECVVGLHLLIGPGRSIWLERAARPVATPRFLERLGVNEVHRSDALFDAALVSFGSFGVIHGIAFETDPLFLVDYVRRRVPFDEALRQALRTVEFGSLDLPTRPYHFEVVVDPFTRDQGVFMSTGCRREYHPGYTRPSFGHDGLGPGDDALAFIGMMTDTAPRQIVPLVGGLLKAAYTTKEVTGTLGEIWTNTTTRGHCGSTAIGIPAAHAPHALDMLLELIDTTGPYAIIPALRFVRGGRATLGWTRWERTCIIEADGPLSKRNAKLYDRFWEALKREGIPHAFHWGKIFPADAASIAHCYGAATFSWMAAREELLPDPEVRRTFSNALLHEMGLSS